MFTEIADIRTEKHNIWVGKDSGDYPYLCDAYLKVQGGIRHLVQRYREYQIKEIKRDLKKAYFSIRPYVLGQPCDGSIDNCVHALFYDYCKHEGLDPKALYSKAYPEDPPDYELVVKIANWQRVSYPEQWGRVEFDGLIESLTEINNHSLVGVLEKEK